VAGLLAHWPLPREDLPYISGRDANTDELLGAAEERAILRSAHVELPGRGQLRLDALGLLPKPGRYAGAITMYAHGSLCLEQSGGEYFPQRPSSDDEEKSCEYLMPPEVGYLRYDRGLRMRFEPSCSEKSEASSTARSPACPVFPPRPDRHRCSLPAIHREMARWLRDQAVLSWVTPDRFIDLC
jgi:hypothetical protein